MFRGYLKSRKRHDSFTRNGENHAFHHHSQKHSDIPRVLNKASDIGCKKFGNSHAKCLNDKIVGE